VTACHLPVLEARRTRGRRAALLGVAVALALGACTDPGSDGDPAPGASSEAAAAGAGDRPGAVATGAGDRPGAALPAAPAPREALRAMLELLHATPSFRFHAEIVHDVPTSWGGLVQLAGAADFFVTRPDHVYVDFRDDVSARRIWLDGETVTLLDPHSGLYGEHPQPGDIDATLAYLQEELDLALPLGELIANHAGERLLERSARARYVGLHDADGVPCHHLAFVLPEVDVQVWVAAEGPPLPRKLVIVFKREPGSPQWAAALMDWDLEASIPPQRFARTLPDDASRIGFLALQEGTE